MLRNKSTEEARKQREKEGRKELAKDSPPTGSEHAESSATLCCTYYKKPSVDSQEIENMLPQPESEGNGRSGILGSFCLAVCHGWDVRRRSHVFKAPSSFGAYHLNK